MSNSKTSWFEMRINPHTKAQAEQLFYSCGLTMSGAISLFIHQSLSVQGLPFNIYGKDTSSVDKPHGSFSHPTDTQSTKL